MKQFFTALLGVASTMGVMAQKSLPQETEPTHLNLGVQHALDEGSKEVRPTVSQQGGARNTIFEANGYRTANGLWKTMRRQQHLASCVNLAANGTRPTHRIPVDNSHLLIIPLTPNISP